MAIRELDEGVGLTLAEKAVVEVMRAAPRTQVLFETVTSFEDLAHACQMAQRLLKRVAGRQRARATK
jgi:hypothetical protein